ncbi:hypothetical protein ILUMI_09253, partial [Ignelater luminosus]
RQLIEKYGFPFENHTVTTADGYILEIHRIPHGRNKFAYHGGPPVLIVPGTLSGSADYVNMGIEKSLGFILADHGYDVWLANHRGTTWSRKHVRLNPDVDKEEFWDFSFQQVGYYDLPACINHILRVTKQGMLFYIGHSQGATSFFVLTSERPEYNSKIRLMVGLAPAAYFGHSRSLIFPFLVKFQDEVLAFIKRYQFYEIMRHSPWYGIFGATFCNACLPFQDICASVFYILAGYSPAQLNKTMIPVIATNSPAGGSFKQLIHYSQLFASKLFRKYDYGPEGNMKKYKQPEPPSYKLSKITAPVALYYGDKDIICSKEDIDHSASEMKNVIVNKCVPGFNHLDVVWGNDVVELIFHEVLELMKRH